jgi:hypothetical protein
LFPQLHELLAERLDDAARRLVRDICGISAGWGP